MKRTHYRILALCLSLLLLASFTGTVTLAAGGECGDNLRWEYEDGHLTISGSGEMYDWSDMDQTPWADYSVRITRLTVGNGVTSIGSCAFSGLYNLTDLSLGGGLKRIGAMAFSDCHILESVPLPDGLVSIDTFAFASDYSVKTVNIPSSVTYIGYGAFCDMSSLTDITVSDGNTRYSSKGGALYDSGVTELIACPAGKTGSFIMPDTVTDIGDYALMGCQISSINMPLSLKTIGEAAFSLCANLGRIIIPRNVHTIGDSAFTECSSLTSISVINTNTHFTSDGGVLYNYNKDRLVCCPMGREGTEFTVPDCVKSINDYAFAYSKLKKVTLGDNVKTVGNYAFLLCEVLESVNIGGGLVTVGDYAFSNCIKLKNIVLPSSCESVGTGAFSWCEELEKVVFNSPVYVGSSAFYWCTNLTRVEFNSDAPEDVGNDIFYACEDAVIYYPAYASGWSTPSWHGYLARPMSGSAPRPGDIDGNGVIDNVDLVTLARYIVGIGQVGAAADIDGNGRIDNTDLVTLARMIVE